MGMTVDSEHSMYNIKYEKITSILHPQSVSSPYTTKFILGLRDAHVNVITYIHTLDIIMICNECVFTDIQDAGHSV